MNDPKNSCLNLSLHQIAHFSLNMENVKYKNEQVSSDLVLSPCKYRWKFLIIFDSSYFRIGFKRAEESIHSIKFSLLLKAMDMYNPFYGGVQTKDQEYDLYLSEYQNEIFCDKIPFKYLVKNFLDGTITSSCHCQLSCSETQINENKIDKNIIQLLNDIHMLMDKKEYSDIILKVGNSCIPAHKLILSSRSPVFCRMFENNMEENKNGYVDIVDTEEHIMKHFLAFLYRGKLEDYNYDTVYALYTTADKYDVPSLLDTCRNHLNSFISLSTVLNILQLGDLHDDKVLKEKCSNFICDNFEQIELKSEWSSIICENPSLASYVLRNLSAKFSKQKK